MSTTTPNNVTTSVTATLDCAVFFRANFRNCPDSLASIRRGNEAAPVVQTYRLQLPIADTVKALHYHLEAMCGVKLSRRLYMKNSTSGTRPTNWVRVRDRSWLHHTFGMQSVPSISDTLGDGVTAGSFLAFETTLKDPPEGPSSVSVEEEDESYVEQQLKTLTEDIRDEVDWNNHPGTLARAVSRSLFPNSIYPYEPDVVLGQRLDAKDCRGTWFPGSIVHVNEDDDSFRVHFDNFLPKWDEVYKMDSFQTEVLAPLHSKASSATVTSPPREFMVYHAVFNDARELVLFGDPFPIEMFSEWSLARGGAHVIAQASRFLRVIPPADTTQGNYASLLLEKAFTNSNEMVKKAIRSLIDADLEYTTAILNAAADPERKKYPLLAATMKSEALKRRLRLVGTKLPFELNTIEFNPNTRDWRPNADSLKDELRTLRPYPLSVQRNISNYVTARHSLVLVWKRCVLAHSVVREVPPTLYSSPFASLGWADETSNNAEQETSYASQTYKEPPSHLVCPITCQLMKDPVITQSGTSFERDAIIEWLRSGHSTCPITREPMNERDLYPNRALKDAIEAYRREQNEST